MNKGGHLAIGFVLGICFILVMSKTFGWFDVMNFEAWGVYVLIIFIYALLADVDHKMSSITWIFIGMSVIGMSAAFYFDLKLMMGLSLGLLILTFTAAQFFPHRGPTHTVWFGALTCIPVYLILGWQEGILAYLIYYSHLFADGEYFNLGL